MKGYYVEWCKTPYSRKGVMIPCEDIPKFIKAKGSSGFRSVFCFHPKDAKKIQDSRCSKGFKEYPVFADRVIIDVDNGEEGRKDVTDKLKKAGLGYSLFASGGKGYHFIIPSNDLYSYFTPYSHMKFVHGLGIEADDSIYLHSSLISLVGRIHQTSKKPKKFLEKIEGERAEVLIVKPPVFVSQIPEDYNVLADGFERMANLMAFGPGDSRYMSLWMAGKCLSDSGILPEVTEELMHTINDSFKFPHDQSEIDRLIKDLY